jgi:HK97 family phage major capsid protein
MKITKALKDWLARKGFAQPTWTDKKLWKKATAKALSSGKLTGEKMGRLMADERGQLQTHTAGAPSPGDVFGSVRVKNQGEKYSSKNATLKSKWTGLPVIDPVTNQEVVGPSELELAKFNALIRFRAIKDRVPGVAPLTEEQAQLLQECMEEDVWVGHPGGFTPLDSPAFGPEYSKRLTPWQVKGTLLSDAISGGVAANPLWFDNLLITMPLLTGQLFPFITLIEMPRSNLVNTAFIGNPTMIWGQAEGTGVQEFDTTSLMSLVSQSVKNVMVAVEVGRDFLSDAAADVATYLTRNIMQRAQNELDRVIAVGNGNTEPSGIFNSSPALINSDFGVTGPPVLGDLEGLMFSVPPQFRTPDQNPSYIMNDATYRRFRTLPVGPGDERRVLGLDEGDYKLLAKRVAIVQSPGQTAGTVALPNNQACFAALSRYRLWRRLGWEMRWTVEGKQLALNNTTLLTLRGRFAGQLELAAAASLMTDLQA